MRLLRGLLTLICAAVLAALPLIAQAQAGNVVTGVVTITQRVAIPSNAIVTVQLQDVSRAGAAATIIAEQRITPNGAQPPYPFLLPYNPAQINPAGIYAVRGTINVDGRLRFTSTQQYRVITGGSPTSNITVVMDPVDLPNSSSGAATLAILALLTAGYVVVRLSRRALAR
ncbi:hypothetical protein HC891_21995 [Candidatus Gracilibacteria bacterium]|nr:hypothetical protein [Candidatus Gracilibacteria bacterium]